MTAPDTGATPEDPRAGRHDAMLAFLRAGAMAVVILAIIALLLPGRAGDIAGAAMIAVLVGVPCARVAWLGTRWTRKRDYRHAATTLLVLGSTVGGFLIATLT